MNKLSRTWRPGARASVMAGLACTSLVCSLAIPPALVAMAQTMSSTSSPASSQAAAADAAGQSTAALGTPNADGTADSTGSDATPGNSTGSSDSDSTAAPADPTDPTAPGTATDSTTGSTAGNAAAPATPDNITTQDAPAEETPAEETPAPDNDRAALDALAAQHAAAVADGTYAIASSASQAANQRGVLDVQGASAAGGATIQLYASNGTGAQRWRVTHDDAGYVTFINVASGLALDVQWGNSAAGTPVQQYAPNGSWSQKWIVISLDDASASTDAAAGTAAFPTRCIIISALAPNIALDLRGGSIASTTPVQI